MKTTTTLLTAALLATGLAGTTLAHDEHSHQGHEMAAGEKGGDHQADMQKMMADMMPAPGDAPSTVEFKKADMAMMHDMHVAYTGDPDVDLRTHMIPHHKGAIAMAKVALKYAKDATSKTMAQKMIDDQEKEVAEMEDWLKQRGKSN